MQTVRELVCFRIGWLWRAQLVLSASLQRVDLTHFSRSLMRILNWMEHWGTSLVTSHQQD